MAGRDLKDGTSPDAAPLSSGVAPAVADSDRLLAMVNIARWTWNPYDGATLSAQMAQMLGVDVLRPVTLLESSCHPDDVELVAEALGKLARFGGSTTYEHRARGAAGDWRQLRVVAEAFPDPRGGYGAQGLVQDITEIVEARDSALRAERQIRALMDESRLSARRLTMALGAANAGVFESNHETRKFWCSPEFVLLSGRKLTYEESVSDAWPFVHPDDRQTVIKAAKVWRTGALTNDPVEVRVLRPDGAVRWMRFYYELRRDMRGRPLNSVGLVLDVDDRKRQELALVEAKREALAAAEAKSSFLASVSHEIRTPMNGVLGVMHLLRQEPLSDQGVRLLDEATVCGGMLSELLNDVLDFSKIEANQLELTPEPTDPESAVEGVASLLRPQAEAKGLTLTVAVEPGIGWMSVDPVRLRQALFNLIGNAVKFTPAGGVTVAMRRLENPSRLRFEITDTGIGIPEAVQQRLFQHFYQADSSTTRRFGGTGLGLAITRRLAEMMGGAVGCASVEGQGSTFWLEVAAEPAQTPGSRAPEAVEGLGGLRVLVVEDNPTNRLIARKILEHLGAFVSEAEDGLIGVEAAGRESFDLILMDVQMPGIDGMEATRRIRAMTGPNQNTAIIALTANVMAHQRQAYSQAGMDGVVAKPISPMQLLTEVARVAIEDLQAEESAVA